MGVCPPPALSLLWLLGVLCEQEGVYITSDEENIESESLTSRASALTRKIAYKKAALFFPSLLLNFPAATAAALCAKLRAVNVHLSII